MSNVTHELSADQYLVTHEVGPNQHGVRLDNFLKERYRRRSREMLKRAIESGVILVQREQGPHVSLGRLKSSTCLLPGDQVLVVSDRKPEPAVDFNYKVLFEDDVLFVIEKPANLPVHPAGRYFFHTLLIHLKTNGHKDPLRLEREYYLVHRIDKETSGILVLTTDRDAATHITRQFFERKTEKSYLAIVRGITHQEFTVELPIRRAKKSAISLKMEAVTGDTAGEDVMTASTRFERLDTAGDFSLVACYPKTGRQHQIRVHLDSAGHPIVGDKLYGMPEEEALRFFERQHLSPEAEAKLLLPRHALHSAGLAFTHPVTERRIEFRSDLPADLRAFFERQRVQTLDTRLPPVSFPTLSPS